MEAGLLCHCPPIARISPMRFTPLVRRTTQSAFAGGGTAIGTGRTRSSPPRENWRTGIVDVGAAEATVHWSRASCVFLLAAASSCLQAAAASPAPASVSTDLVVFFSAFRLAAFGAFVCFYYSKAVLGRKVASIWKADSFWWSASVSSAP